MSRQVFHALGSLGAAVLLMAAVPQAVAQKPATQPTVRQLDNGTIVAGNQTFYTWNQYVSSDFFRLHGRHCGTVASGQAGAMPRGGGQADCTFTFTSPAAIYDPSVVKYRIPVVVHVLRHSNGVTGDISPAMVQSQIAILNEDFLALVGSNGQAGTDIQIEFRLATVDPSGNPTTGITYSDNTTWFNDGGSYWNTLAWDTNRYLNIYTNTASGALGYVPDLPQGGIAGANFDRVVILWSAFGRNAPIGPPFDQGRTATHEVGHYLGLEHTFSNGCGSATACYTSGDLICDTKPQSIPTTGCSDGQSCGIPDPIHNYMDYSDDLCMTQFTPEQARRMRCSLEHYRPLGYDIVVRRGDCDGNGLTDVNDISCFVGVLLGNDADPIHRAGSDTNGDGANNGADVSAFVISLLAG